MTADHDAAVRASWALLTPHFDALSARFYERLFALDPALAPLFRHTNLAGLRHKFIVALGEMVRLLDEPERLVAVIAPLGRRHAGYGARERDYATAAVALIGAMRDVLGDGFTGEMEEGWRELHGLVSAVMVRAADDTSLRGGREAADEAISSNVPSLRGGEADEAISSQAGTPH